MNDRLDRRNFLKRTGVAGAVVLGARLGRPGARRRRT